MSILARYKKPGGFRQLLQLIETSQPVKQEKLLQAIENEDPRWANLIREKKITSEIVLSWPPEELVLIFENMLARHCAVVLKKLGDAAALQYRSMFVPEKFREVQDQLQYVDEPKDSELIAAYNNMLETVRHLDSEKIINLRLIDPSLDISDAA